VSTRPGPSDAAARQGHKSSDFFSRAVERGRIPNSSDFNEANDAFKRIRR
jgi:hypothetical protein